ncbi:MAG: hypothetical protein JXB49_03330 [Bacteroidales bacterium]|nr:hypothetical protein [Bacteroidales bacterium]
MDKAEAIPAVTISDFFKNFILLLKNPRLYVGIVMLIAGIQANFLSQSYLNVHTQGGKTLPVLSDMVLDNIPFWDISYLYDLFNLLSVIIFTIYIIHKSEYERVPYMLTLCGIFYIIRGLFIILTPLGNPPMFEGTGGLFNGFSKYELGVYPSGHTGIAFMYFLLTRNNTYRVILFICLSAIIITLFMSHGHYSIDILSGILFVYAIKAFSDKYLMNFFSVNMGLGQKNHFKLLKK